MKKIIFSLLLLSSTLVNAQITTYCVKTVIIMAGVNDVRELSNPSPCAVGNISIFSTAKIIDFSMSGFHNCRILNEIETTKKNKYTDIFVDSGLIADDKGQKMFYYREGKTLSIFYLNELDDITDAGIIFKLE